ncbi:MAG TPA: anthrone oxygenase family protein [Chthoniobacterales bacterium]
MNHSATLLAFATALGCGLIAGVFFAFSTFVMKALARLPAHEGIAAMQSINVFAVNSGFLAAFLGTSAACLLLAGFSLVRLSEPTAIWLLLGAVIFLAGTFLVTMVCNVPMNNALAALSPTAPGSAERWADYLKNWTLWNHVRTLAALAATGFLIAGLR